MFCTRCGLRNAADAQFCFACGHALGPVPETAGDSAPQAARTDTLEQMYAAAVGYRRVAFYLPRFRGFDAGGRSLSWNWPAFFVSFYWLLYRKLWGWAALYFFGPLAAGIVEAFITALPGAGAATGLIWLPYSIAIWIVLPASANWIYYRRVQTLIADTAAFTGDHSARLQLLAARGGTSNAVVVIIVILATVFVLGVIAAVAIPAYQDYALRAVVVRELDRTGAAKRCVAEGYERGATLADSGTACAPAGGAPADAAIEVAADGRITVTFSRAGLHGQTIVLEPREDGGSLQWDCAGGTLARRFRPAQCR